MKCGCDLVAIMYSRLKKQIDYDIHDVINNDLIYDAKEASSLIKEQL